MLELNFFRSISAAQAFISHALLILTRAALVESLWHFETGVFEWQFLVSSLPWRP